MITSYIALGSNLGDPRAQLSAALTALSQLNNSRLLRCSSAYGSPAIGPGDQPDYINAVASLETDLTPLALLDALQEIEQAQGRIRGERWAARTLDLDILLYGDAVLDEKRLQIPHPRLQDRNFVLYPLYDIAPGLTLPCGRSIESLLEGCPQDGLQALGELSEPGR